MDFISIKQAIKKAYPKMYYEFSTDLNNMIISIEKRNNIVYIYVYHKHYFSRDLDDSFTIYNLNDADFYKTFTYNITENDMSINEYTSNFNSEEDCKKWLIKNNYNILQ